MKICVIPDVQVKPDQDYEFLTNIGHYLIDKKPDVIVQIGDFADLPSLSSWDKGKKSFEGRRYTNDVDAVHQAMQALLNPIQSFNAAAARNHKERYRPRLVLTLGNHCNRIDRAVNDDPKLEGLISVKDLKYEEFGWEVYPFLDVVVIGGVAFSHYFVTGVAGRPAGTASAQLNKKHQSCIAGHQQGFQMATAHRADGKQLTSIIAGSCYMHEEEYLGPQGNKHWRGLLMLHSVEDGEFDLVQVPLRYINDKYGT